MPQKPTRLVGFRTKWKVSPKTDEIMRNSGTATAVPAVSGAAPLLMLSLKLNIFKGRDNFIHKGQKKTKLNFVTPVSPQH